MTLSCYESLTCVGHSALSDSLHLYGLQTARLLCPWNSTGKNTGVGSQPLFQRIFLAQGLNLGLLHCRQILYLLSHQGIPVSKSQSDKNKVLNLISQPLKILITVNWINGYLLAAPQSNSQSTDLCTHTDPKYHVSLSARVSYLQVLYFLFQKFSTIKNCIALLLF